MKGNYLIEYINENEFRKRERALKKYNMLAYKKFAFEYSHKLKEGIFLGEKIEENFDNGSVRYKLKLPTDSMFVKVHGPIILEYLVYEKQNVVVLDTITPDDILNEGHKMELSTYKGVVISKVNSDKDMFKINLLNMMQ